MANTVCAQESCASVETALPVACSGYLLARIGEYNPVYDAVSLSVLHIEYAYYTYINVYT
jgi:hypothetical protein